MHPETQLITVPASVPQPRVSVYPHASVTEPSLTLQTGNEWITVRWRPTDDIADVVRQLKQAISWLENR